MNLEENPIKANGHYTRDLLALIGPVEDPRVPHRRGCRPLGSQGLCPLGVPAASQAHKEIGTLNQGGEAANKGGGISREEAVEKLLYLVLSRSNDGSEGHRLRGFAEIAMGSDHAAQTH